MRLANDLGSVVAISVNRILLLMECVLHGFLVARQ